MAESPVLKILLYVDSDDFLPRAPGGTLEWFTTERLQQALRGGIVPVDIMLGGPHLGVPMAEQLAGRHEVWFFLFSDDQSTELTKEDRDALKAWMDAGNGVLITGDHANTRTSPSGGLEVRGLGAPIGRGIPRARHMRVWDGPPDIGHYMANSTEDGGRRFGVDPDDLELDDVPQRLLLPAAKRNKPHAIFIGRDQRILDKFPDHMHEGAVRTSVSYPDQPDVRFPDIPYEWPYFPPKIEVVAHAVNWQNGRTHPLMALWDQGTGPNPPGRIIADSSFHHYVDENLDKIAMSDGAREDWSKIQELYCSQAAWLAPLAFRKLYKDHALKAAVERSEAQLLASSSLEARASAVMPQLAELLPGVWYHQFIDELAEEYGVSPSDRACGPELDMCLLGAHLLSRAVPQSALGLEAQASAEALPAIDVVDVAVRRFLELKSMPSDLIRHLKPSPAAGAPRGNKGDYKR